jgi:hypothetical protein
MKGIFSRTTKELFTLSNGELKIQVFIGSVVP